MLFDQPRAVTFASRYYDPRSISPHFEYDRQPQPVEPLQVAVA